MHARIGKKALGPLGMGIAIACAGLASAARAVELAIWQKPIATTITQTRNVADPAANDFIRLIFVPPNATVSALGRGQARVFMAATSYFVAPPNPNGRKQPLSLATVARFTGGAYSSTKDLAAMRCRLPNPRAAAIVASWPNVMAAVVNDLPGYRCNPMPSDASAENQVYCLAHAYRDRADVLTVKPIAQAVDTGLAVMQVRDSKGRTGADVLGDTYGIGLGFSGLGFSVAGSLDASLAALQSLQQSVVTEYLVKNVSLKAAGCSCIQVHSYPGRDTAPLDPDFISARGKLAASGLCVITGRLGIASVWQASQ